MRNNHVVIMAGGVGSRFWPLSTPEYPKQFIDILGCGRTLIQLTVDRFKGIAPMSNFWVVTNAAYVDIVKQQIPDMPASHILAEPAARNTAPCIAWACWSIKREDLDANVVVTPADAVVMNPEDNTPLWEVVSGLGFSSVAAGSGGSEGGGSSSGAETGGGSGSGGSETVTVAAPTFSGETQFTESTQVSMSGPAGASIYYTTDGSTPSASSTVYSGPLTLSETTTVKAVAVKDGVKSAVTERTYTKSSGNAGGGGDGEEGV